MNFRRYFTFVVHQFRTAVARPYDRKLHARGAAGGRVEVARAVGAAAKALQPCA